MTHPSVPCLDVALPDFVVADAGGWVHFQGHRAGLSSVVRAYLDGYSAEMLAGEYPPLSLATIQNAIAFYLEHREEIDRYLEECAAVMASQRETGSHALSTDALRQRLAERALAD